MGTAAAGLAIACLGTLVVTLGVLVPRHAASSEILGGLLVVAGLVLIGSRLAVFRF